MIYLKSIFQGQTAVKFYTNAKLREKHLSNIKIQGLQAPMHDAPLSDDHANEDIMHTKANHACPAIS